MARIPGDDRDLPAGWHVDHDGWGARPARPGDEERRSKGPPGVFDRACTEHGMLCVHTAAAAEYLDGGKFRAPEED